MVTYSGSSGNSSSQGSSSGSSNQSTTWTATPEETERNKVMLQQLKEFDPMQRQLNQAGGSAVLNLLQGKDLPGYLGKLPGGIDEATTADIANRAIKDIQPFFGQAGLLDSGVNAAISGRTAGDIRRASAEFNINNLMQLLNVGVGGQAQVQQPALATQNTLSSALAGLRSSNTSGSYKNDWNQSGKWSQQNWGVNIFGGICWVAAELFGGWGKIKTFMARYFIMYMAPEWFRKLYVKHGEKVAEFIHDKPVIKALLRPLFEVFAFLAAGDVKEVCHG